MRDIALAGGQGRELACDAAHAADSPRESSGGVGGESAIIESGQCVMR
jgi:hypothetical protein